MRWVTSLLVLLSVSAPGLSFASALVGYARPSSVYKLAQPSLYQALNLLDGRKNTAWCEGMAGAGIGETVAIGFKGTAKIDEIRFINGDSKDSKSFQSHNRIKTVVLSTDESKRTFTLVDTSDAQTFKLEKPLEAGNLSMEIVDVFKGTSEEDVTCISDIIFMSKGKALNGSFLGEHLAYRRGRTLLMGSWYGGPKGAPNRFLDFYMDGTFSFSYRPFDPEERAVSIVGEYVLDKGRLVLKIPEKGWVEAKAALSAEQENVSQKQSTLIIQSAGLDKTLAGHWMRH